MRRLATKQPVCLDWSRLWVNTYIHILKTDRCTIKALPLQNYLQRRGFPAKNSDWQDWLYSCGESFGKIKDAQWLVFTSKNAVAGFAYNAGNVVPAGVKVAVVGKNTQNAIRTACGIEADYVSSKATGLALGEELMNIASGRIVYLCAEVTSGSLEEAMKEYENLIKIPVYRNEPVDYDCMEYDSRNCGDIDGIIVTSGSSGERIKWLIDRLEDV